MSNNPNNPNNLNNSNYSNNKRRINEISKNDYSGNDSFQKKQRTSIKSDGMIYFNRKISDIDDLIFLGSQYKPGKKYNINIEKLYRLIPVLTKLKKVIGMETDIRIPFWTI